jgi:hypothetical protein
MIKRACNFSFFLAQIYSKIIAHKRSTKFEVTKDCFRSEDWIVERCSNQDLIETR